MHFSKRPLDFTKYEDYEISQNYTAYILEYLNITESEAENIEYDLLTKGNKIFHSDLVRVQKDLFNLEIIIGTNTHTF